MSIQINRNHDRTRTGGCQSQIKLIILLKDPVLHNQVQTGNKCVQVLISRDVCNVCSVLTAPAGALPAPSQPPGRSDPRPSEIAWRTSCSMPRTCSARGSGSRRSIIDLGTRCTNLDTMSKSTTFGRCRLATSPVLLQAYAKVCMMPDREVASALITALQRLHDFHTRLWHPALRVLRRGTPADSRHTPSIAAAPRDTDPPLAAASDRPEPWLCSTRDRTSR